MREGRYRQNRSRRRRFPINEEGGASCQGLPCTISSTIIPKDHMSALGAQAGPVKG